METGTSEKNNQGIQSNIPIPNPQIYMKEAAFQGKRRNEQWIENLQQQTLLLHYSHK